MKNEAQLSKKSREFLENLHVYLFSAGKSSEQIEEITEELEVHLLEAEKDGKPIEKVVGNSPKEYMEFISREMTMDYKTWTKYILLFIFGSFSFIIFADLLEGTLSYSLLAIAGHIVVGGLYIPVVLIGFKYIASRGKTKRGNTLLLVPIALLPLVLYVGLIFLDRAVETPVIHFGQTGSWIVAVLASTLIIGVSIWAKTWVMIILIALLTLPDYLLSFTPLSAEVQLITGSLIMYGGILVYFWVTSRAEKE